MARKWSNMQRVYIADGFADDCEELIHRSSRVDILNYQSFCIYYKDMNFASVYQGRTSNAEIAELTEELLQVAKYFMVLDTSNFEESVAGLFLVYALLNLQPYPGFAPLRLVADDLPAIDRIQRVARRERRYDVLYVLGSVLIKGPVQYHAAGRERGMEPCIRKYLEGSGTLDLTGVRPKGVYFRQNEELDIIREMGGLFKRYSTAKKQIPSLQQHRQYSNDNLASDLGTSLKKLISGIIDEETDDEPVDHYNAVQEIKTRAMRGAVPALKHLNPADQRSPEKTTPQSKIKVIKKPSSPKLPSVATKRTNANIITKKPKRVKTELISSSDEETKDKSGKKTSPVVNEVNKVDTRQPEQEINVEIDSLPSIMTTESEGKVVEIQIIDEMKGKKKRSKNSVSRESDDVIFKKPLRVSPRLRVAARRDMKQTILKSKFKKMGMLPVANFEDK